MNSPPAPRYIRLPVPAGVWPVLRALSVASMLALVALLLIRPALGLPLLWTVVVPLLPLVFLAAPGVWRNVCPMAAVNQLPRVLGLSHGRALPHWARNHSYAVALAAFALIVPARLLIFDQDAHAAAALLGGLLVAALVGGVLVEGKAGWCGSFCPLRPVQGLYGHAPLAPAASHCRPCVGCTDNCTDLAPTASLSRELRHSDPRRARIRLVLTGALPGLILAFYLAPPPAGASVLATYADFAPLVLGSLGALSALQAFLPLAVDRLVAVYATISINLFYWFNVPTLIGAIEGMSATSAPEWLVWVGRENVLALSLLWLYRAWRTEREGGPIALPQARRPSAAVSPDHESAAVPAIVTLLPGEQQLEVLPGATLLEVLEPAASITAGCRVGVCGSDAVWVLEGRDRLSAPDDDERATLERLSLGLGGRMACRARVLGDVSISLERPQASKPARAHAAAAAGRASARRVVIVGNGVAGLTAAEAARRHDPDCLIDLVSNEPYPSYNRMALTQLITTASAMRHLRLRGDGWDDDIRVTSWLNTRATTLWPDRRVITLATGEALSYDSLVLAMGARANGPRIDGFGKQGSFVMRGADDAIRMRSFVQEHCARRAVVAGGGPLGLETAVALGEIGLEVTLVQSGAALMSRHLDEQAAALLQTSIEDHGVKLELASRVESVRGEHGVSGVTLTDGREFDCDLFVACIGVSPNVELARSAGLAVGHGIVVDDRLQTSAPGVLAAGDVAEHQGQVYGLWGAATEQGAVAGASAVGHQVEYHGSATAVELKLPELAIRPAGAAAGPASARAAYA